MKHSLNRDFFKKLSQFCLKMNFVPDVTVQTTSSSTSPSMSNETKELLNEILKFEHIDIVQDLVLLSLACLLFFLRKICRNRCGCFSASFYTSFFRRGHNNSLQEHNNTHQELTQQQQLQQQQINDIIRNQISREQQQQQFLNSSQALPQHNSQFQNQKCLFQSSPRSFRSNKTNLTMVPEIDFNHSIMTDDKSVIFDDFNYHKNNKTHVTINMLDNGPNSLFKEDKSIITNNDSVIYDGFKNDPVIDNRSVITNNDSVIYDGFKNASAIDNRSVITNNDSVIYDGFKNAPDQSNIKKNGLVYFIKDNQLVLLNSCGNDGHISSIEDSKKTIHNSLTFDESHK
jgi:hypothetical protein